MKNALALMLVFLLSVPTQLFAGAEGKPAPDLQAKLLGGADFSLKDSAGQVVIVNFWATWCAPCRKEMPALESYYQKHQKEGLKIIAISIDETNDEAKVHEVMKDFTFSGALARNASYKGYGRIWRVPLTFVIDRKGILRMDGWFGKAGFDLSDLEQIVTPLLTSP
jgi:thiol-disulfide isomerase/thioredoxin